MRSNFAEYFTRFIADRLQNGERQIADKVDDATVIFADVTNFRTSFGEITLAEEIVKPSQLALSALRCAG